jgi:hypothetical protein
MSIFANTACIFLKKKPFDQLMEGGGGEEEEEEKKKA